MSFIYAMMIAFSMYSKIPMPNVNFSEKNMRYALCFFPLVGALEGVLFWGMWRLLGLLNVGDLLRACVLCVLPILFTGGIHMDGFLDTMDALSSYQPMQKKLEILQDSHTGAFAIIGGAVYLILYLGGVGELDTERACLLVCLGFIISRTLSGLSLTVFRSAKNEGLLYLFASASQKSVCRVVLAVIGLLVSGAVMKLDLQSGAAMLTGAAAVFVYYRRMSYREFGGITGDLAGYFVQLCELTMLYGVILAGMLRL